MKTWREWVLRGHANDWRDGLSLGIHLDYAAPYVEIHFAFWIITVGRVRMADIPGFGPLEATSSVFRDLEVSHR
jgi:hypothetical protein